MAVNYQAKLRKLGYIVEPAMFADSDEHDTVYVVIGYGINTQVAEADIDTWKSLSSKKAHDERVQQHDLP
jgi:biotin-(acetyl-CoA carboxylase) ligase